jgi:hypothetical protein
MLKRLRFLHITTCPVQQLNFAVVCILIKLSHLKELLRIHISTLPEHLPRLFARWWLAACHFCHDPQVGRITKNISVNARVKNLHHVQCDLTNLQYSQMKMFCSRLSSCALMFDFHQYIVFHISRSLIVFFI